MPTYEYACRECDQHLEVVQSFKDEALTTCGACGGPLRKVFSAAGIIFKGSGYYVNDTRQKQSKTSGDGKAAAKDGGKSDSGDASSSPAESGSAKSGSAKSGSSESGSSESGGSKSDSSKSSGQRGDAESA